MRAAGAALAGAALLVTGCSSTQAKSREQASHAKAAVRQKGLVITRRNKDVDVLRTALVHDRYGTAAVVELRSGARAPQAALPVAIDVRDANGKSEFANDLPGLEPALTHVALLRPRERFFWVYDQVRAKAPHDVVATVGPAPKPAPATPPQLKISGLQQDVDPDGVITRGFVSNPSGVEQRRVTIFAVALKGKRVVAAGRSGVERIKPHDKARFKVFWIGKPGGARVEVFAPPTVLEEAR
jgi:hypothetical protein